MAVTDSGLGLVWDTSEINAPALHYLMTDFFSSRLNDARNNSAGVLSMIPSSSQRVSGKFVLEPVKFGRNPNAFNFVRETGKFPDPGHTKARQYSYRTRTQFHRFVVQGKLLRAARGDATRYVDPLADMMADHMDDYLVDMARIMYSDGSGRVAELASQPPSGAGTSVTFTLRSNQDILTGHGSGASAATSAPDEPPTHYMDSGGRYAVCNAAGTLKYVILVSSIDSSNTVTAATVGGFAGTNANTGATGDWLVKCSNDDTGFAMSSSGFRQEPVGMGGIFGALGLKDGNGPGIEVGSASAGAETSLAYSYGGTDLFTNNNQFWFQGLATSAAAGASWEGDLAFNQGIVSQNGGVLRTPSESLLQRFASRVRDANNAKPTFYLSRSEVRDTYAETLLQDKRYNDTVTLKGGWDPALMGPMGLPWVTDIRCQHNRIYMPSLDDGGWMRHVEEELGWASEQGANVWQYLQDDDLYQARMVEAFNIGVGVRNRCGGLILDVSET